MNEIGLIQKCGFVTPDYDVGRWMKFFGGVNWKEVGDYLKAPEIIIFDLFCKQNVFSKIFLKNILLPLVTPQNSPKSTPFVRYQTDNAKPS